MALLLCWWLGAGLAMSGPEATAAAANSRMTNVTYTVADLIFAEYDEKGQPHPRKDESAPTTNEERLMSLIMEKVAPHTWSNVGGPGTVQYFPLGQALVVNQTQEVQEQVYELLQGLRKRLKTQEEVEHLLQRLHTCVREGKDKEARALAHKIKALYIAFDASEGCPCSPLRLKDGSSLSVENEIMWKESQCAKNAIEAKLATPVSLNFKDVPLKQVIFDLNTISGINVVADEAALRGAGVSLEQPLSLMVEKISLKSALNLLLKQVHLTWVIKDHVVLITTEIQTIGKLKTAEYPLAELVVPIPGVWPHCPCSASSSAAESQPKELANVLIDLITKTVAADSWSQAGGPGTITYCPEKMALVACQTADAHEEIAELLKALARLADTWPEYTLEIKEVRREASIDAPGEKSWPKITFLRGQLLQVSEVKELLPSLHLASRNELKSAPYSQFQCQTCPSVSGPSLSPLRSGTQLTGQLTSPDGKRLYLDLAIQTQELEKGTPKEIHMAGTTHRLARQVEPGKSFRLVLERDRRRQPSRWMEFVVREVVQP